MRSLPVVLITGATDGLGLALARQYAGHARLVLLGRRPLAMLADPLFSAATYCQADLADPQQAAQTLRTWLTAHSINQLDLLMHNAAVGWYGPLAQQSPAEIEQLLQINLAAPLVLTDALLPFVAAAHGRVVLISSVASQLPAPLYASYGASKAALEAWARSVRLELQPRVLVQVVRIGATRTGMHAKVGMPRSQVDWMRFPAAEAVAAQIVDALRSQRFVLTIGWRARLLAWSGSWLGAGIEWMLRRWQRFV